MHAMACRGFLISGQRWETAKAAHTFTDWDHVQRVPVFRQEAVIAGVWYPPEAYDPDLDMSLHNVKGIG